MKHIDIPDLFKETNQYFRELIETKKTSYHYQNYLNRLHYLKNCVLSEWDIAYQAKDYAKLEYIAHFVIELQKLKNTIETSHDITEVEKNLEAVLEVAKPPMSIGKKLAAIIVGFAGAIVGAITGAIMGTINPGILQATIVGGITAPLVFFIPDVYLTWVLGALLCGSVVGLFQGAKEGAKAGYEYVQNANKNTNIEIAATQFFKLPSLQGLNTQLFFPKPHLLKNEEKQQPEPKQTPKVA